VTALASYLAQANAAGGPMRCYICGACRAATESGDDHHGYHFDDKGHTVDLRDKNGLVTHKYACSPYGKLLGQVQAFS